MMSTSPPQPKRVHLSDHDLGSMSKQQLVNKLKELDSYVDFLEERQRLTETGDESEELKMKLDVARRKENTLVARLANKEQEGQDYHNKIQEMKLVQSSRYSSSAQLRSMQLDPAINIVFIKMHQEIDTLKEKLEQLQNEQSAWNFTPDSQTGKKLMSKCHMLHQENEELGMQISSGRIAKLEGEIALEKALVQEMKKGQSDLDEFLGEIDEDVEGMQGMIYMLQQQLKDTKLQLEQALDRLESQAPGDRGAKTASDTDKEGSSSVTSRVSPGDQNADIASSVRQKPSQNHLAARTDARTSDVAVKVEPMEVDSSDQWTTRTHSENASLVNSTHSPCNSSSSNDLHKPNTTTADHRPSSAAMTNEVSASGDAKLKRAEHFKKSDTKHEPSTTQNGVTKRTTSLDALDE